MKDISAFPTPSHNLTNDGMTLRDYFAAKALQALISADHMTPHDYVAIDAYSYADAILKARNAAQ
jgi:hypothetical protein